MAGYLMAGGGVAKALTASAPTATQASMAYRRYQTMPHFFPPKISVKGRSAEPGYVFVGVRGLQGSQPGALIIDNRGEPVWFSPLRLRSGANDTPWVSNFAVSRYRDEPVLVYWEGEDVHPGLGRGQGIILDSSYREVARIRAANGRTIDLHELVLTPEGTALFTCFPSVVRADLSWLGGPPNGYAYESIIQEVDVASGRLLMEWRSLDHIPLRESYRQLEDPYDYLHANSIDVLPDGHLLVSARHTWTLYKIHRRTGRVLWRMGGKRSDFSLASNARFHWQHHAHQISERLITVFDNGSDGNVNTEQQSRGLILEVDLAHKRVQLARAYRHPQPLLAVAGGSVQIPDGHVVVGWGKTSHISEFDAYGNLVCEINLGEGRESYRGFRFQWSGTPHYRPSIAARSSSNGRHTIYASWNGATDVAHWQLLAGSSPSHLRPVGVAARRGFETAIMTRLNNGYVATNALDASGRALSQSPAIKL